MTSNQTHPSEIWQWTVFWGVTTCSQYWVFTLYYYHLVVKVITPMAVSTSTFFHQQILWGSDFCCLTSRARGGLVPVGCTENMTCMGSFIDTRLPDQAGKKTPPWFLILFFQKKSISWNMCVFFLDLNGIFFGTDPPLIWDPLGPHTIPPRHSAWGSSDVPSPRWLFCGGYGFHGIKSGFLPGWCTKPRGRIFFKTMEAHFFNLLADYGLR